LLFDHVVKLDLEGVVAKRKNSPYKVTDKPSRDWIKIKNAKYSQAEGRAELFELKHDRDYRPGVEHPQSL
jgi:ATP-dependent DNA ligase